MIKSKPSCEVKGLNRMFYRDSKWKLSAFKFKDFSLNH